MKVSLVEGGGWQVTVKKDIKDQHFQWRNGHPQHPHNNMQLKQGPGSRKRERGRAANKERLSQGGRTLSKKATRCQKEAAKLLQGGHRLKRAIRHT
jgi:hypothetical protein